MQVIALLIVAASGLWLVCVALLMIVHPRDFLHFLSLTASTWRINVAEQSLRLLAGVALTVRAESSKLPILFELGGWFIVASSVVLVILPLRWHAAYAIWWSRRLTPSTVRAIAPFSAALGMGLVYAVS